MKILFYVTFVGTPFFETELELMEKHLKAGDEVYLLKCNEAFKTCLKNLNHHKVVCLGCKSMLKNGLKFLSSDKITILDIPPNELGDENLSFKNVAELMSYKINDMAVGLAAASSLVHRFLDHDFDTKKYQEEINIEISTALHVYDFFENIVKEIKPDAVYIFNGRFSTTRPATEICRKMRIDFYTHEHAGLNKSNNRYTLCKNTLPQDIDYYNQNIQELTKSIGENEYRLGEKFYSDRRSNTEECWCSYTQKQKNGLLPATFDKKRRNIAIFNSTIEEGATFACWKNRIYKDEDDAIFRILDAFKDKNSIFFYLRLHPNLNHNKESAQMKELREIMRRFKNIEVIQPNSPVSTYGLVDSCNVVLTFGSTVGAEACFWGKPSILAGRAVYESLDCCYKPKSHEEVVNLLKSDLAPKDRLEAIKYGYWQFVRGVPHSYFKHEGLYYGTFKGKRVLPNFIYRLIFLLIRIIKNNEREEVKKAFKEF